VSAFANSAGGLIVYGMIEAGHKPTQIDPVDPHAFNKEWLENVITSNVQPRIDGLHINPFQLSGGNAGRVVYVVTVPQSLTAHQARDKRYYKRFNFKAEPMEHYEVQDTMNRAKTPIIEVDVQSSREIVSGDLHRYVLRIFLTNAGTRTAKHLKAGLWLPDGLNPKIHRNPAIESDERRGLSAKTYKARRFELLFARPLLPMDTLSLERVGYAVDFEVNGARNKLLHDVEPTIEWTVYADDIVPQHGHKRLLDLIDF
jgi:hypothetical protein